MNGPSDLQKLIAACELGTAATPSFYVPRQPSVTSQIEIALQPSQSSRVLLMGQNGVGKSTELHTLTTQIQLSRPYLVIAASLDVGLDLRLFGWHEMLIYSACQFVSTIPPGRQPVSQFNKLLHKFGVSSFQVLLDKMRHEPAAVHAQVSESRAMLWDQACGLIRFLEGIHRNPALLIWDGLEKLSRSETQKLFEEEGRYLDELPCRAVITAPMRMSFEPYFTEVADRFLGNVVRLRAMSHERIAQIAFLRGLTPNLLHIIADGLAHANNAQPPRHYETLMNRLIDASAGLPRQLLQLTAAAAKQALNMREGLLLPEHVTLAIRRASETLRYQLEPGDFLELRKPDSKRSNEARARLLDLRALVEYEEPEARFRVEVNPLLTEMLATGR